MKWEAPAWLRWWEGRAVSQGKGEGSKGRFLPLVALGLLGMALMLVGSPRSVDPEPAFPASSPLPVATPAGFSEGDWGGGLESPLARALEETLSRIRGVGRVHVLVTWERSAQQVLAGEVTRESRVSEEGVSGGQRTSREERETWRPLLVRAEDGRSEKALTEAVRAPQLRGVLVVAEGGDDPRIRRAITQAVEAVTGLGAHRVVVLGGR